MNSRSQAGNVLFLILIAVALFAALSYAVSHSNRSSGSGNVEQRSTAAGQILQYATGLRSAIQRLMVNGCTDQQISFEPPPFSGAGSYFNPSSPTNFSCHVFHPNGGGQAVWTYKPEIQGSGVYGPFADPIYNGTWGVNQIGFNDRADFTMILGLTDGDLCKLINERVSVNNPGGLPPHRNGSHIHSPWDGVLSDPYPGWADWSSVSGADTTLDPGHMEACMNYFDRASGLYIFYAVLLAR